MTEQNTHNNEMWDKLEQVLYKPHEEFAAAIVSTHDAEKLSSDAKGFLSLREKLVRVLIPAHANWSKLSPGKQKGLEKLALMKALAELLRADAYIEVIVKAQKLTDNVDARISEQLKERNQDV